MDGLTAITGPQKDSPPNRGGRPRKFARSVDLHVVVEESEKEQWEQWSQKMGHDLSTWVRQGLNRVMELQKKEHGEADNEHG